MPVCSASDIAKCNRPSVCRMGLAYGTESAGYSSSILNKNS